MPKLSFERAPHGARRSEILPPLIPLQQPSNSFGLVEVAAPHAKLQHELSHETAVSPDQTTTLAPQTTDEPRIQFLKRQNIVTNVVTTVTNADVVVVDGSGHTVATTVLDAVPTGSLAITLPFTTVTVPPLASITGVIPLSSGIPDIPKLSTPSWIPIVPTSVAVPFPLSTSISIPIPAAITQQILSSPSPTASAPVPATTGTKTGNNNLGLPSSSTTSTSGTATAASTGTATSGSSSASNHPSSGVSSVLSSTSIHPSSTGLVGGATGSNGSGSINPTATGSTPAATSTAPAAAANSGSGVNVPVVGGVVGGLAGFAVLLFLLLLLAKWWKRRRDGKMALRSIDDERYDPANIWSNAPMTQNTAVVSAGTAGAAGAAGAAGIGGMIKRMTGGSTATSETSPSERGFQNFGGRKLESVLISGGDGYGEPSRSGGHTPTSFARGWAERFPYETPSKHSSMIVGPATPYRRPSGSISGIAELAGSSSGRPDSDTVKMMPSPAKAATYINPGQSANPPMSEVTGLSPPMPRPRNLLDPLGRSRHSQDGSRGSKFTEDL